MRRCRCRTSAGCRSSCARPSTRPRRSCTSASTPTACCTPCASRSDARQPRGHDARPPARRRPDGAAGAARALTGGGPVAPALLERAQAAGVPVVTTYGLTEACSQVTTTPVARSRRSRRPPGRRCSARACASPPTRRSWCRGRRWRPGSSTRDGWLHTGDLGSLDDDGRLTVTGRKADTIISGGENVAPAEVEAVLEAHPDVLEAAVIGRSDPQWGEAVTAIVVARPGLVRGETLRAHCARALAPYKVPRRFVLRPSGCRARRRASSCAGS